MKLPVRSGVALRPGRARKTLALQPTLPTQTALPLLSRLQSTLPTQIVNVTVNPGYTDCEHNPDPNPNPNLNLDPNPSPNPNPNPNFNPNPKLETLNPN